MAMATVRPSWSFPSAGSEEGCGGPAPLDAHTPSPPSAPAPSLPPPPSFQTLFQLHRRQLCGGWGGGLWSSVAMLTAKGSIAEAASWLGLRGSSRHPPTGPFLLLCSQAAASPG